MKQYILGITFVCALIFGSWVTAFAEPKADEAGSEEAYKAAEQVLNSNYKRILRLYEDDPVFIAKIKNAQRAWLKFRDAEIAALFPHAEQDPSYYGSILPVASHYWATALTQQRARELARWLEGVEEGDVFAGSIKSKPVQ